MIMHLQFFFHIVLFFNTGNSAFAVSKVVATRSEFFYYCFMCMVA